MKVKELQFVTKSIVLCLLNSLVILTVIGCENSVSKQHYPSEKRAVLIYENNFDEPSSLSDWVLEGPGTIEWQKGGMILIPDAQQVLYKKWNQSGRKILDAKKEYYPAIQSVVRITKPSIANHLTDDKGHFDGGHIVCWNKKFETDGNYIVEYDFEPLSPIGLGIVFFSAKGLNGEDVLSDQLKPRHGAFKQYIKSDINCYHISYWANSPASGKRNTSNLRKNSGFYCLANGHDPSVRELDYSSETFTFSKHKVRLVKLDAQIRFYIDGQLVIDFTDKKINDILDDAGNVIKEGVDTGNVLAGGRIGLRQMAGLKAEYSNFKVYKICKQENWKHYTKGAKCQISN